MQSFVFCLVLDSNISGIWMYFGGYFPERILISSILCYILHDVAIIWVTEVCYINQTIFILQIKLDLDRCVYLIWEVLGVFFHFDLNFCVCLKKTPIRMNLVDYTRHITFNTIEKNKHWKRFCETHFFFAFSRCIFI